MRHLLPDLVIGEIMPFVQQVWKPGDYVFAVHLGHWFTPILCRIVSFDATRRQFLLQPYTDALSTLVDEVDTIPLEWCDIKNATIQNIVKSDRNTWYLAINGRLIGYRSHDVPSKRLEFTRTNLENLGRNALVRMGDSNSNWMQYVERRLRNAWYLDIGQLHDEWLMHDDIFT